MTQVSATVWNVWFRHTPLEPKPGSDELTNGHAAIVTSDPTGRDLYDVTERVVLGERAGNGLGFTIVRAERCCDARGTATPVTPARVN